MEPVGVDLALRGQKAGAGVAQDHRAPAVDNDVKGAVGAAHGLAELRVLLDTDRDARQWLSASGDNPATDVRRAVRVDGTGADARLNGVGAGVEELGGGVQVCGDAGVQRWSDG